MDKRVAKKKYIFEFYKEHLSDLQGVEMMSVNEWDDPNFWLSCILLNGKIKPIDIIEALEDENIESRPIWKPMHLQPFYKDYDFITTQDHTSVGEDIFNRGVCLPSDTKMTDEDLERVVGVIKGLWETVDA